MDPNAATTQAPSIPGFDQDTMAKIQQAQQAGYSPSQIATLATQYQASKGGGQSTSQGPDVGGIIRGLLPTIGGVGGSLLGLGLGPLGAIGGGAVGSGLGEYLKEALTPNTQVDPGSILKEGAIGGAGGLAGEVLGPILRLGGRLLPDVIPNALDRAGTGFVASQYNVPRTAARALDLSGTLQSLGKYGISNINDVVPAADQVTGADGIISQLTRKAVGQASPIDTTGITQLARQIAANPMIGDGKAGKFIDFIQNEVNNIQGGAAGGLGSSANPDATFSFIQDLEKQASLINRVPIFQRTGEDMALKNGYQMMADELKSRLFEGRNAAGEIVGPGADTAIASGLATPEQLQQLAAIHPQLAADVSGAQTVGDLRSIAAPFVKGSQLAQETEAGSQIGFNNAAGAVKGVGKLIQNPLNLAAVPLSSNTANAGIGQGAQNLADILRGVPNPPSWLGTVGGMTGGQGIAQSVFGGNSNQPTGPGMTMDPTTGAPSTNGGVTTDVTAGNPLSNGLPASNLTLSPYDQKMQALRQVLGQLMFMRPRQAADIKAAFDFMYPQAAQSSQTALNLQHTSGMMQVINHMMTLAPQAQGIGPFANVLQHAQQKTGFFGGGDPATIQLNADQALLQQMIATEVHRRGMSPEAMKVMADAFPDPSESHGTYIQKLSNLQNVLQTYFGSYGNTSDTSGALPASTTPSVTGY